MSKEAASMAIVEDPAQRFSHCISRVDFARYMLHNNRTIAFPILDGEVRDVNVARPFSGDAGVDNRYSRVVVFEDDSRIGLGKTEVGED